VVETKHSCLLIEPKRADDMDDSMVQSKKRAAQRWCQYANEQAANTTAKAWHYLLVPHDQILANTSLDGLVSRFGKS